MGISAGAQCTLCYLKRNLAYAEKLGTEQQLDHFCKELLKLFLSAPEGVSAPWYAPETARLFHEIYGLDVDRYKSEKAFSNAFAMQWAETVRTRVAAAEDSMLMGLKYAILGNYIDFSALQDAVNYDTLEEMLRSAQDMALDMAAYEALRADLEQARKLLYITDNAGEIVFDRIFAEQIHEAYPHLEITFMVRGGPANNDALREDAEAVGIPFPVIDNGNCVAGTQLDMLSREARAAMDGADVIFAKGQGNVETLYGSHYPIYYAFLVKCRRFSEIFQKPLMTPMLVKEM